jgi:hypothetical protein
MSRSLFRDLGYASMQQYAVEALGFSRNRFWQFMKMARDLRRLEWTKAQQVGRIATPQPAGADAGDQGGAAGGGDPAGAVGVARG